MAVEGLMEVTSGEGGTVRLQGAEEAGILVFWGDMKGTIGVDGEEIVGEKTGGATKLFHLSYYLIH